ncbi:MAG: hypothetical protein ABSA50_07865 [Candidatus Bathyarchaeia archaeon]
MGQRLVPALKMRTWMLLVILTVVLLPPNVASGLATARGESYLLVGGQNGGWFQSGQTPRLYKIMLSDFSVSKLTPVSSEGTVWTGGWNGSQWLVSGWGVDPGATGSDPYLYLYDGQKQVVGGSLNQFASEASWHGGDVFAVSYNGHEWLLSGLGSGSLGEGRQPSNHMALGLFDGYHFTDLSSEVPNQWDAILYANAWNGHYWLVGGGWEGNDGELYRFDGMNFTDLSFQLESVMHQFHSVQAIQWNGDYWLVGGVGFLVKYDGQKFTDLTPGLNAAISARHVRNLSSCCNAVNALEWNGASWQIGGGAPISVTEPGTVWIVNYDGAKFTDLTPLIQSYIANPSQSSSILTITYSDASWFYGGYADGKGILLSYANHTMADLSYLIGDEMSTVNWVGGWPKASNESSIRDFEIYAASIIVVVAAALTIRLMRKKHFSSYRIYKESQ